MFAFRSRPEVGRWLASLPADRVGFRQAFSLGLAHTLVVSEAGAPARVVGTLRLAVQDGWAQKEIRHLAKDAQAELGWSFDPGVQGQGFATEAVAELLAMAFAAPPTGLGLRRVEAHAFADNHPCVRLMERVGMRLEAYHVADSLHRDGTWRDGVTYALLACEWRAATEAGTPG